MNCPECNKKVSDEVANCSSCGYPLKAYLRKMRQTKRIEINKKRKEIRQERNQRFWSKPKNIVMCIIAFVSIVAIICITINLTINYHLSNRLVKYNSETEMIDSLIGCWGWYFLDKDWGVRDEFMTFDKNGKGIQVPADSDGFLEWQYAKKFSYTVDYENSIINYKFDHYEAKDEVVVIQNNIYINYQEGKLNPDVVYKKISNNPNFLREAIEPIY